jgi:hypothetical protein
MCEEVSARTIINCGCVDDGVGDAAEIGPQPLRRCIFATHTVLFACA